MNSPKVSQLPDAGDSLVDISENSRFAQWRRAQEEDKRQGQEEAQSLPSAPVPLRPSHRAVGGWKKWVYGFGALVLAAAVFVGLVFFSPLLATRTITVQGASLLDEEAVQQQLGQLEGVPMTRISESEVASLIGHEQVLYGVSLQAHPPHELVVQLHERVPVAVVQNEGSFVLVDDEGVQLGTAASVEDAGVPLVAGGLDILGSAAFNTVTGVLAALPGSILSQVSEAKADSASTITLEMVDGTRVVWGTPEESDLKAKVLVQLMDSVGSEQAVETYDVSSPLVPTVK
ncbi:MAG: cell division protein FtsQ/DivIB [Rothia sp. (in: high G+C Gram-positive bacteria)]|nr:cell division protein FtsQ/DivIB [Rothia sp. (in: high G+C Gram-positive bacteria)]